MIRTIVIGAALAVCAFPAAAVAQQREQRIIESSSMAIDEIMAIHLRGIPRVMLANARGIAIIPDVIKAGFVIGGRHGKGVLMVRDDENNWHLPTFITLTGGNIGYQIGIQSTDLILVFKTKQSVENILSGKLTLGADAAAAAGPVGRQAAAATDGRLKAEIYSYSRSRGLFAGVSVDGSVLKVAPELNAAYYGSRPGGELAGNDPAMLLAQKVIAYCQPLREQFIDEQVGAPAPAAVPMREELPAPSFGPPKEGEPTLAPPQNADRAGQLRVQLSQAAQSMSALLDRSWSTYLALPAEVFQAGDHPDPEVLRVIAARYNQVAGDTRYRTLATRAEFRTTHELLGQYLEALDRRDTALRLPPPPTSSR